MKVISNLVRSIPFLNVWFGFRNMKKSYLSEVGWINSRKTKMPIDAQGNALPWMTYSSIAFLGLKLREDMHVFEYGSGNSTLWLAGLVKNVTSVEHNETWFDIMQARLSKVSNVDYLFRRRSNGEYSGCIREYTEFFDVVVLDGRDRIRCCELAVEQLKDDGIIVWDNSDRIEYNRGYNILKERGFKRLDFPGLGPINSDSWCTSIFYKENNCFGI